MNRAVLVAGAVLLLALSACKGDGTVGIKDVPEDMNVSPRSMEAYDPAMRDLEAGDKKPVQPPDGNPAQPQ